MSLATETLGEESLEWSVEEAVEEIRGLEGINEKTREQILKDWATATGEFPTQEQYEEVRQPIVEPKKAKKGEKAGEGEEEEEEAGEEGEAGEGEKK